MQQVRVKCTHLAERSGAEGSGGAERQPPGCGPHAAGALATPNAKALAAAMLRYTVLAHSRCKKKVYYC